MIRVPDPPEDSPEAQPEDPATSVRDPIAEFDRLFDEAQRKEGGDATACALATATSDGEPSVRMVLLKSHGELGFVIYTNFESRKARELEVNPRASLCFYWESTGWQVRIEGAVERVSDEEADAYFASRPRLSRIGAWASKQSQKLSSRAELLRRFAKYELRYSVSEVPRPPFWGGYRIRPKRIEFWSAKTHRLHDRRVFTRRGGNWAMERLYP